MSRIFATPLQLRILFAGQRAVVFPNKSADIYVFTKMAKGDERNTIQIRFLRYVTTYVNF